LLRWERTILAIACAFSFETFATPVATLWERTVDISTTTNHKVETQQPAAKPHPLYLKWAREPRHCAGVSHQRWSFAAFMTEAVALNRTAVIPDMFCLHPVHNSGGYGSSKMDRLVNQTWARRWRDEAFQVCAATLASCDVALVYSSQERLIFFFAQARKYDLTTCVYQTTPRPPHYRSRLFATASISRTINRRVLINTDLHCAVVEVLT